MALSAAVYQFITQIPTLREIDPTPGPQGPLGVRSFWLVPTSGWLNGQRFPHHVTTELNDGGYDKTSIEGVEYYRIPEESSNLPGRLSHYAQLTGVAELQNPPGGGVNRVTETLTNYADATVAPDEVRKYVDENDSFEEARKKASDEEARVERQVTVSPAREPSKGDLVETQNAGADLKSPESKSVSSTPKTDSKKSS